MSYNIWKYQSKMLLAVAGAERLFSAIKRMGDSDAELLKAIQAIDLLQRHLAECRRAAIFALNVRGVSVLEPPPRPPKPLPDAS